jgi:Secretion system C-terminal sorting domain
MKKYTNRYLVVGLVVLGLGLMISFIIFFGKQKFQPQKAAINQPHKDVAKADNPDKFVALYNDLRTRASESSPDYATGYALTELNKARQARASARLSATYTFTERGPANVPGRTRGLLIDTDDTSHKTWFAGGVGGGVWKTVDAGLTWVDKTPNVPNMAISWLVMAESNHDIMYAGTGEGFQGAIGIRGNGIYKSTDRGENWNLLPFTIENDDFQMVNRLVVDPANPDIVLAATSNDGAHSLFNSGIFKSVDGGLNWVRKFSGQSWVQQIVATPGDFNALYATVLGVGIYKSVDAGENWTLSSAGLSAGGRIEMAVSPVNPSRLFASLVGGLSGTGSDLYISDDAGALWQVMTEDNSGNDVDFLGGQGGYDNTIMAHPYDQDIVYVGGVNLWKFEIRSGSTTTENQFLGAEEQNTSPFLSLVNFGATYYGGKIDAGNEPAADFVSVEVRFGPDGMGGYLKQFAHRFTIPDGQGSGVPAADYAYQGYVEVPFQVWDITNNRQLMVSFRDQQKDNVFNLLSLNTDNADWTNNSREYIFAHNIDYDVVPDANVGTDGGHEFKYLYNLWPYLSEGGTWDEVNLPASKFIINFGSLTKRLKLTTSVSDAYSEVGGNNNFSQVIGSTNPLGVHPDHHNILPVLWPENGEDFQLLVAGDGGIYVSDLSPDPGVLDNSFNAAGLTYNTSQFYAADKAPGENRYIGGLQDNGTWMSQEGDDGSVTASYKRAGFGDGFGCAWNYAEPKQIITTSQYGKINKSRNRGVSFGQVGAEITDVGIGKSPFVTEIENLHSDPNVVFTAGTSGVWRSTNFGDNWQLSAIPDQWSLGLSIKVRISQANSHIVWAGRAMREVPGKVSLHVSTDEGVTFSPATNYTDRELGTVSGLATHPVLDSTAFALFSFSKGPKILRTDDLGSSWYDISGFGAGSVSTNGFPDVALYDLLVMPYDTTIIWAGTEIGIFESTDAGTSWHMLNSNMPATSIWEMKIVDKQVVIGSYGRGIWSVTINELPGQVYIPEIISSLPSLAGELLLNANMSVAFDSTYVYINDVLHEKILLPSVIGISTLKANYFSVAPGKVYLKSFYRGVPYVSHPRNFELFTYNAVLDSYENDFNTASSDFTGYGFNEKAEADFSNRAIHSSHPYEANAYYQYVLKSPIRVKSTDALINFHEVVIVEPGQNGSLPGSPEFNDHVIVQGSIDGIDWVNLLDEYDASDRNDWLEAFSRRKQGSETILKLRAIDLLSTYTANDEILIRFFLKANSIEEGWGWAIDNLRIQTENVITGIEPGLIAPVFSVYPNPATSNFVTIIRDSNNDKGVANLFDLNGQLVLSQPISRSGKTIIQLPAVLKNGIYSLIITSGINSEAHKIIIQRNL